jgi:Uma2 family endonuclease
MVTDSTTISLPPPPTDKPDALYEFVDGEWKETPRMGALAGFLASILVSELNAFARSKRRGFAVTEVLFRLHPNGPARRPDVAFVASDRSPFTAPEMDDPPAFDVVPNLAVEVVSPSNGFDEVIAKIRDYFFAGVQLVWVVIPRQRQVYAYESPEQVRILSEKHELDGGAMLPGFRLPLADLFTVPVSPPPEGGPGKEGAP